MGLVTFAVPKAFGKTTKAKVKYQSSPKAEQRCDTCLHFIPENNSCKVVEGTIGPEGWCTLYVKDMRR